MRKTITLITFIVLVLSSAVMAQTKFWVCKNNGTYVEFLVSETDSITFTDPSTPTPAGEKCKASDYAQVTIGTQTWMAENYRCSKYDTESEAYKEGRYTILSSDTLTNIPYTPYYTDATDTTKWKYKSEIKCFSEEQLSKLGYLYNWAAAVGVENGYNDSTKFTGNRQGICPNGWHVPSMSEWQTLYEYVGGKKLGEQCIECGERLMSKTGWRYNHGTDVYGFAALPAGYAGGSSVDNVGYDANFWSTLLVGDSHSHYLHIYSKGYVDDYTTTTNTGLSVRCLRN